MHLYDNILSLYLITVRISFNPSIISPGELGFEPATFRLLANLLYLLSHNRP